MKFYLSTSDFCKWSGISRGHYYSFGSVVMSADLVDVLATARNMIEDAKTKRTTPACFKKTMAALEQKIIALECAPRLPQKIYLNTSDVLERLQFGCAKDYLAFIRKKKVAPASVKVKGRSGGTMMLFDVDELDEFMEEHRQVGLSMKYIKKFIRGEYAPEGRL